MKNRKLHGQTTRTLDSALRSDGWNNAWTGLGTLRDRGEYGRFDMLATDLKMSQQTLESLYYGDDLCARGCDAGPEEELRRGFDCELEDNAEASSELAKYHKRLGTVATVIKARKFANVFGSAAIIIGADDGVAEDELDKPINEKSIKKVGYLSVVYGTFMRPAYLNAPSLTQQVAGYNSDPTAPDYGAVQTWQISSPFGGRVFNVDASRLIVFDATTVTDIRRMQNAGLADSLLQRAFPILRDFNMAVKSLSAVLPENGQGIWKIKDFISMLARDPEEVQRRFRLADMTKSVTRSIILDTEGEDFERRYGTFAGYGDIFNFLMLRLAAAWRMPVSLLFGREPAGMNATGEADFKAWYGRIESRQQFEIKPAIETISRYIALAKDCPIKVDPDEIEVTFPSLNKATEAEQATIEGQNASALKTYVDMGAVTPEEVATAMFGPEGRSKLLRIDLDEHQALVDAEAEEKQKEAERQFQLQQAKVGLTPAGEPVKGEPVKGEPVKEESDTDDKDESANPAK